MKFASRTMRHASVLLTLGLTLTLTACAGEAGEAQAEDDNQKGFEYGMAQEELNEILEDLEPVELVYQAGATSPDLPGAASAHAFQDAIEERSNGKITLEVIWGQAIAPYAEVDDALVDGRLDIAFSAPPYQPEEYPTFEALNRMSQLIDPSPLVGEIVANAVLTELAWDSDTIGEYEEKGLIPLSPAIGAGGFYTACTSEGTSPDDWRGRQVRVGLSPHHDTLQEIGISTVSMEYAELYEAMQRGTVDCTLVQMPVGAQVGAMGVAPHVGYPTEFNFAGRASAGHVAGPSFNDLPLVYQQIIFDAEADAFPGFVQSVMDSTVEALGDMEDAGGQITPIDPETQQDIIEAQTAMIDEIEASGALGPDPATKTVEVAEKWFAVAEELGYEDGGGLENFTSWYDPEELDLKPFADRVFEEVVLPHRPE